MKTDGELFLGQVLAPGIDSLAWLSLHISGHNPHSKVPVSLGTKSQHSGGRATSSESTTREEASRLLTPPPNHLLILQCRGEGRSKLYLPKNPREGRSHKGQQEPTGALPKGKPDTVREEAGLRQRVTYDGSQRGSPNLAPHHPPQSHRH